MPAGDKSTKRRGPAPTLQDIANEAGVSAMAVSVVLNAAVSSTRVSEATRARILLAAQKLKYRPNAAARGLQRRRMDTIGVVGKVDSEDVNLYFLEILNGVLHGADEFGQNMTVFSIHSWTEDQERILRWCDGRIDGMILLAPQTSAEFGDQIPGHTPMVTIHSNFVLPGIPNLTTESESGAYTMVKHLLDKGHRRILHLAGPSGVHDAEERLKGYKSALQQAGLPVDPDLVVEGRFTLSSGREIMQAWLAAHRGQELPTAIFAANDATAAGAADVLKEAGFVVPRDISLVGIDDSLVSLMCNPPLTSLRQPLREMGRRAVALLMREIETHHAQPSEIFETQVVERASVAAPRSQSLRI